jgi:hypothetical protein
MSMALAKFAIAALISGTAIVSGAGQGWLTVLLPDRGTEVRVTYEDRDGNGYLSFNAPDRKNRDVLTGGSIVRGAEQKRGQLQKSR